MKSIKKVLVLLLAGIMIFSLAACGNKEEAKDENVPVEEKEEEKSDSVDATNPKELYHGFGLANLHRQDQGEDDEGNKIYSFNQVMVNALFDEEGRIVDILIDQVEVGTPNYPGDAPVLNGFPGQGEYAGKENTYEVFEEEVSNWVTKRERGEDYKMPSGTWAEQMDKYQEVFTGKTYNEIIDWTKVYLSDLNAKPVGEDSKSVLDREKFENLSDEQKEELADLTSVATMSINDSHGNILIAINKAYNNRAPVEGVESLKGLGTGFVATPRKGPAEDMYSFNEVFANTLFDADGNIASIFVDQLEVTTPAEDKELSIFGGFPGQGVATEGTMRAEISNWTTKRDLGEDYKMPSGTWAEQMDAIQEALLGKSKDEVEAWGEEFADSEDLVSGATMTIEGESGDIIGAILKSFDNQIEIDVTVK